MTSDSPQSQSLTELALAAMKTAVARVVRDHRRRGAPMPVWRDGKVVLVPPDQPMVVREAADDSYQTDSRPAAEPDNAG